MTPASKCTSFFPIGVLLTCCAGAGLLSCNTTSTETGPVQDCTSPYADAGPDQSVALGSSVTLDGGASQPCTGNEEVFTWGFSSVPIGSAVNDEMFADNATETAVQVTFTPDIVGTYVVTLSVDDGTSPSSPDMVVIEVTTSDQPPVADCGDPVSALVGDSVTLDGSRSYDPEGVPLRWSWSLSTLPPESSLHANDIYNPGGPSPTVIPDVSGVFVASLVVGDKSQWSEPSFCTITVTTGDQAPVADAGTGGTMPPCTVHELVMNGFGSYDPEGDTLVYLWSLVNAPASSLASDASFSDTSLPNPTFNWDVSGSYTMQLEVFDGELWSVPDLVTYIISDMSGDVFPVANAGADQTITQTGDCSSSAYVWTCDDCPAETVSLDGSASYDADGDEFSYFWYESTGEISFSTPYSVYTDATTPSIPATYATLVTETWTITLDTSDCSGSSSDNLLLTYNCTGAR
jgi:hypothetical protein